MTVEHMKRAVDRIQKRLADLAAFNPADISKRWDPTTTALEAAIEETLAFAFGHDTPEYKRYRRIAQLDHGEVRMGVQASLPQVHKWLAEGKHAATVMLQQAARGLNEEIQDIEKEAVSGGPIRAESLTPSQSKAWVLLKAIYEKTHSDTHPIDDVTTLDTGLTKEEARAAFMYLKERGLIQTFAVPDAARISANGIDEIEKRIHMPAKPEVTSPAKVRKVFIVHGHDSAAREAVARFVERIGFQAVILAEQANQGRTIIEKVEAHGDVGFAVVLLTPDDQGCVRGGTLQPRPRQNVLLELGYFLGRLGRANVCALATASTMELPTDFAGVVWESFDPSGGWKAALARELRAAGFEVDLNKAL
jgi:predicted nucleotide-binding protein